MPALSRLPDNVRGALWMLASAFLFSVMASLVKYMGGAYSPAVETFFRQAAGLLVLLPVIIKYGKPAYATTRPGILLFRSACNTTGMILTFFAFQSMPLAEANALSFTRALWVVPLAAFVVREKVGVWRVGAALAGFAGVLVMLAPGLAGHHALSLPALGMLASSFLVAFSVTGIKVLSRDHQPIVMVVWSATLGTLFSFPIALMTWRWPAPVDLALLSLMGVVGVVSMVCYVRGMSTGDAAAMTSIDYTRLVFAAAAGYFLFHEVPTIWTLAGAALVVSSTLVITIRELHLARSAKLAIAAELEV